MSVKLSIVMPLYNVEKYLRDCLDSVLAAADRVRDIEILAVDDGSTDGTVQLLKSYVAKDRRIRFSQTPSPGAGASVARNLALEQATGDYVGFVDGDDLVDVRLFEMVLAQLNEFGPDVLRFGFKRFDDGAAIPSASSNGSSRTYTGSEMLRWGLENFLYSGQVWRCFVRRKNIGDLRFQPDLRVREDVIFLLNLLGKVKSVRNSDYAGYFYRMRDMSAMHLGRKATDVIRYQKAIYSAADSLQQLCGQEGCSAALFYCLSKAGIGVMQDWVQYADPAERIRDREILDVVLEFARTKRFTYSSLRWLWRPSVWLTIWGRSFLPLNLMYSLKRTQNSL